MIVVVAAPAVSASAAPDSLGPVRCGQTLVRSVSLRSDLAGCPGGGLVIGADNVTVNLNGHRVSTTATDTIGVDVGSHHGVTIRNGTISGFATGIQLDGAQHSRVSDVRLVDSVAGGILLVNSEHNTITATHIFHTGADLNNSGILLYQSDRNRITSNVLTRNGDGIQLIRSSANVVVGNVSSDSGSGISLYDAANGNTIAKNVTNENSDTGILLDQHDDNNRIESNSASGNGFAGIGVGASAGNQVIHNAANHNLGAGIAVVDAATGTLVLGNTASSNGGTPPGCTPDCPLLNDGIYVDAAGTTLTRNSAHHNADLGIDAVASVVDGGRNRAIGNGNPAQCTGVVCRPGTRD